jgi:hypothetical protein
LDSEEPPRYIKVNVNNDHRDIDHINSDNDQIMIRHYWIEV